MVTIADVRRHQPNPKIRALGFGSGPSGGRGGWAMSIDSEINAYQKIGDAIANEMGISIVEASTLPDSTVLGPEAETVFREYVSKYR